jgi:hypothetical protein
LPDAVRAAFAITLKVSVVAGSEGRIEESVTWIFLHPMGRPSKSEDRA